MQHMSKMIQASTSVISLVPKQAVVNKSENIDSKKMTAATVGDDKIKALKLAIAARKAKQTPQTGEQTATAQKTPIEEKITNIQPGNVPT